MRVEVGEEMDSCWGGQEMDTPRLTANHQADRGHRQKQAAQEQAQKHVVHTGGSAWGQWEGADRS